ncbi:MAG: TetR/AcrR family transcriptional regulator [Rhodococcus sp. (in: high G+C Gram-positive bacteria)]|uniref:TetR/AcrR family transcriptional regulator n=1 Tax=Rhodococcus sp. TaxID=1831 RepID=UPI002ADCDF0B|nr:TetR/AcrR family transcriptional regulator [Rhodococcus sp. (in: high G+C Gram-positive bacteria)]
MTRTFPEADHPTHGQHPPIQARAQKTRAAILDAAAHQFDVLGYAETSISTIIDTGELTKGSIYFHFSSKEAIAKHLIDDWTRTLLETVSIAHILGSQSVKKSSIHGPNPQLGQLCDLRRHRSTSVTHNTHLRAGMKLTLEPSIDNDHAFSLLGTRDSTALIQAAITAQRTRQSSRRPADLAWNLCAGSRRRRPRTHHRTPTHRTGHPHRRHRGSTPDRRPTSIKQRDPIARNSCRHRSPTP